SRRHLQPRVPRPVKAQSVAPLATARTVTEVPRLLVLSQDPGLAQLVGEAYRDRDACPTVAACADVADLGDLLSGPEPFDALVVDDRHADRRGLQRLRVIHEELPAMSLVLALERPPAVDLRDVIRAGAVDLIELPAAPRLVAAVLDRAVGLRRTIVHGTPPVVEAPPPGQGATVTTDALRPPTRVAEPEPTADPPPSEPAVALAKVVTIASASGGCGKTFLAANMAWYLATHTGRRACIIDLDLQFGEVSSSLRLRPRYTIAELIDHEAGADTDLAPFIEEFTEVHDTGIHVLAAPRDPAGADAIGPADVGRVIDAARRRFDYVVIDTPPALADTVVVAFNRSDELYVMATLDVPSVRNMRVFLGTLERLQIPKDDIRLLLNKAERDSGVDVRQVLKLFPQGFDATLPYAREVSRSLNMGKPVMAASPTAEISRLMGGGLRRLLPPEAAAKVDAGLGRRSWFRRSSSGAPGLVATGEDLDPGEATR
ncbi:MAG TPA: AAA family ATPase, partial [Acidimicrobiales bacterium]